MTQNGKKITALANAINWEYCNIYLACTKKQCFYCLASNFVNIALEGVQMILNLTPNKKWVSLSEAASLIARAIYPLPADEEILITSIMKVISTSYRPVELSVEDINLLGVMPPCPMSLDVYGELKHQSISKGIEIIGIKKSTHQDTLMHQAIAREQHLNALLKSIKTRGLISHSENLIQLEVMPIISAPEFANAGLTVSNFKKYLSQIGIELCEDSGNPAGILSDLGGCDKEINLRIAAQRNIQDTEPREKDLVRRNENIKLDHANGLSYPVLVKKYGLCKTSISKIINKDKKSVGGSKNVLANTARRIIKIK